MENLLRACLISCIAVLSSTGLLSQAYLLLPSRVFDGQAMHEGWAVWNDQVLKESNELRAIRGAVHAERNLLAGFTTVRELGTEGAGYADVALKQAYGMAPIEVLRSVTAGNAEVFHLPELGAIKEGFLADIIAVEGNPLKNVANLRKVGMVMKDGVVYKRP